MLIERWETTHKVLKQEVISAIQRSKQFETIEGLQKVNDKWDLRGLKFPDPKNVEKIRSYDHITGPFLAKKIRFSHVDLSYADLNYSYWEDCELEFCVFNETKLKDVHIMASDFLKCDFIKSNFTNSFIGQNVGDNSGSFIDVDFIECNLSSVNFCFPRIEGCSFERCNLKKVNFDGSRFVNCRFEGILDSCFFRGYSIYPHTSFLWIFNRAHPRNYPNLMMNVDFSKAILFGVSFTNEINLTNCILPQDGSALLVKNREITYQKAKDIINREWDGEYKRIALSYIDEIFLSNDRQHQDNDIVDMNFMKDGGMDEFGRKLFDLLKTVNDN